MAATLWYEKFNGSVGDVMTTTVTVPSHLLVVKDTVWFVPFPSWELQTGFVRSMFTKLHGQVNYKAGDV